MYDSTIHIRLIKRNRNENNNTYIFMKAILIIMLAVALRLIYATIFEHSSLFVGFIGVGLAAFSFFALVQEFRESKKKLN